MHSGNMLYEKIEPTLKKGEELTLDFQGVDLFASPFFNASIGYILKDLSIEDLKKHLSVVNINPVGNQVLNLVIKNAIEYYSSDKNEKYRDLINKLTDKDE